MLHGLRADVGSELCGMIGRNTMKVTLGVTLGKAGSTFWTDLMRGSQEGRVGSEVVIRTVPGEEGAT